MIDLSNVTELKLGNAVVERVTDSLGAVLWEVSRPEPDPANSYFYVEDISGSDNTLSITKNNANAPTVEVFKSTDGTNWTSMGTTDTTAITATVPANGKLYLKATANMWATATSGWGGADYYNTMICNNSHRVGGNIMSLLYGDNFEDKTVFPDGTTGVYGIFGRLLYNNNKLVSASRLILPAITAVNSCYFGMFEGCTLLTAAPALPATTLGHSCYRNMFKGCTSITQAPALPATTLVYACYEKMFQGCTLLTTAPELPATTLKSYCYQQMFRDCINLNSITTYAQDISAGGCLEEWLKNVSATGDFYNLGGATYPSGTSGIPTGWTEHTLL